MSKGSEAQKQRPYELLWMLWFDEKSISKLVTFQTACMYFIINIQLKHMINVQYNMVYEQTNGRKKHTLRLASVMVSISSFLKDVSFSNRESIHLIIISIILIFLKVYHSQKILLQNSIFRVRTRIRRLNSIWKDFGYVLFYLLDCIMKWCWVGQALVFLGERKIPS